MKLNQKIKKLRKEKGLTQERLAEQLGVSLMTVRRWEWGETSPNSNMLVRLAEIFGLTPDALLEGEISDDVPAVTVIGRTSKGLPNMAYWGGVADSAKKVATYGDATEVGDVTHMLRMALSYFDASGREAPQPVAMA